MASSVQFYGKDSVMSAAKNLGCTHWAVFISRQLFMKCESIDLDEALDKLDQCLDMLSESNTQGIYCIKFFETDKGQIMKINEKSLVTGGSFNFKMIDQEQHAMGIGNVMGYSAQIMELKKQVADLKKELLETEPDEPETIGSILMGALKDPQQADHLMQLFQMGRMLLGFAPIQQPAAAIGNAQPQSHAATPPSEDEQDKMRERFANAVDILGKADPHFLDHLEKLAVMAQKEPGKFNMLISML